MRLIIAILSALLILSCSSDNDQEKDDREDMQAIQAFVQAEMGEDFEASQDYETVIALRDYVYRTIPVVANPLDGYFEHFYQAFLSSKKTGHLCYGIAINGIMVAESFGIPARLVQLYSEAYNALSNLDSHASMEVWIGGQWIIMDPTFNISIWLHGEPLGWDGVYHACGQGDGDLLIYEGDGYDLSRFQLWQPFDICHYTKYIVTAPIEIDGIYYGQSIKPDDWDGIIYYQAGYSLDVAVIPGWYHRLAAAPWRN